MAYNSLHTGIEALINTLLLTTPCQEVDIILSPNHDVIENVLKLGDIKVKCVKSGIKSATVTFHPPYERENGDALTVDEIDRFTFEFNEDGCIYARTIDINGIESAAVCTIINH